MLVLLRKSNFLREYHLISCFLNKRLNINLSKNWNMNTAIIKNIYCVPRLAPSIFGVLSQVKYKFELILLSKYKKPTTTKIQSLLVPRIFRVLSVSNTNSDVSFYSNLKNLLLLQYKLNCIEVFIVCVCVFFFFFLASFGREWCVQCQF